MIEGLERVENMKQARCFVGLALVDKSALHRLSCPMQSPSRYNAIMHPGQG